MYLYSAGAFFFVFVEALWNMIFLQFKLWKKTYWIIFHKNERGLAAKMKVTGKETVIHPWKIEKIYQEFECIVFWWYWNINMWSPSPWWIFIYFPFIWCLSWATKRSMSVWFSIQSKYFECCWDWTCVLCRHRSPFYSEKQSWSSLTCCLLEEKNCNQLNNRNGNVKWM